MIKENQVILLVNSPSGYARLMRQLPKNASLTKEEARSADVVQVFVSSREELETQLPRLKRLLKPGGKLWVTYPKRTLKKLKPDINRDTIREFALTIGLEAVAIFSVDENWSALRLKKLYG